MKKLYMASAAASLLLLAASCSETYDILPAEYAKVVRLKTSGPQDICVYSNMTEAKYTITIMKGGHTPTDACTATLRAMTPEEFDIYLAESGAGYSYIPSNCYSFGVDQQGNTAESVTVNFEPKQAYEVSGVLLYPQEIGKFFETYTDAARTPVIPIVLESADGTIDENSCQLFLMPTYSVPTVGFKGDEVMEITSASDAASLRLGLPMESPWDMNITVEVDPTLLEEYNTNNHNTYGLMPADAYSSIPAVELKEGADYAPLNIQIDPEKAGFRTVIPLRITAVSMEGIGLAQATTLVVYNPNGYLDYKLELTADDAFSPDDANDECLNNAGARGTDGDGVAGLFDGVFAWNTGYFHSCYFDGHHCDEKFNSYVEIDLKAPRQMVVFEFTNRIWYATNPQEIRIWALNPDTNDWVDLGKHDTRDIFNNQQGDWTVNKWPVGAYVAPFKFQKVRFSVVKARGYLLSGTMRVSTGYWACSELGVYAK